jgi:rhamnulose-1-phosphate aldolase
MDLLKTEFVKGFLRMMTDGSRRGWHERNGGNLSYRLKPEEADEVLRDIVPATGWLPIRALVPGLAGDLFLITGTGKFFRNAEEFPMETVGIIQIDVTGASFRILWGMEGEGRPTSELPTHMMNQEKKKFVTNGLHRVIYHAHTTNLIALSFVFAPDDRIFTRQLWDMMPECPLVFPEGIGVLDWMIPGGRDIGETTSRLMEEYNVVLWGKHGTFCSGETFDTAFGLMDTVEKAAEMLVKVLSIRPDKGIDVSSEQLRRLAEAYGVRLNPKFL